MIEQQFGSDFNEIEQLVSNVPKRKMTLNDLKTFQNIHYMLKYAINQMENYVRIFDEMGTYLDF